MDKNVRLNTNQTKSRLRKTLCERKSMQKFQHDKKVPSVQTEFKDESLELLAKLNSLHLDNIDRVVKFIEGDENQENDDKKKAKKARQREKKDQEKQKLEEEKAEIERKKEALRIKTEKKGPSKKAKISKDANGSKSNNQGKLIEEQVQALITFKKYEKATKYHGVTVTLKKCNKTHEELMLSLVNGKCNTPKSQSIYEGKKSKKKKSKDAKQELNDCIIDIDVKEAQNSKTNRTVIPDMCGEPNCYHPVSPSPSNFYRSEKPVFNNSFRTITSDLGKQGSVLRNEEPVDFSLLRLPPGITITKVKGPVQERTFRPSDLQSVHQNPPSTSGVISNASSLNSETFYQMNCHSNIQEPEPEGGRRSRRKRNKKKQDATPNCGEAESVVTLKNPYFTPCQNNRLESDKVADMGSYPATIFKNENGMVTIRSSRLHQSLNGGAPIPNLLTDLKPVIGPDISTPHTVASNFSENGRLSPFNPQEVLSGLPAIEITKVDKCSANFQNDNKKSCQTAEVSIIPTHNGERYHSEKEDWHYDMVFTPKEILEDDMDAEERELESFKRFCQESVPPKRKEKVAHLNVKDIVLRKKSDENSL